MEWFINLPPALQALMATLFTWGLTALGSSMVFLFRTMNRQLLNLMLGFAAGVMVAASYWSLLAPAIEMSEHAGVPGWVPAAGAGSHRRFCRAGQPDGRVSRNG